MKSPITGKAMKLVRERRSMTFRKEEFEIWYHHYLCEDSGETFEDEWCVEVNIGQVRDLYRVYRERYKLPN